MVLEHKSCTIVEQLASYCFPPKCLFFFEDKTVGMPTAIFIYIKVYLQKKQRCTKESEKLSKKKLKL
jgi:hypothetical protein